MVTTLGSISHSPFEFLSLAAASRAGGEDFCWATRDDVDASPTSLTEWSAAQPPRSFTPGVGSTPSGVLPIDRDEFWATNDFGGGVVVTPNRIRLDPAQTSAVSETATYPMQARRLVPDARRRVRIRPPRGAHRAAAAGGPVREPAARPRSRAR